MPARGRTKAARNGFVLALAALAAHALRAQPLESLARAYRENPTPTHQAALLRFAGAHPKDASGALALMVLGAVDQEKGRHSDAVARFSAAGPRLPALADYAAAAAAQSQYELKNYGHALRAAAPVWAAKPVSPLTGRAAMVTARSHLDNG